VSLFLFQSSAKFPPKKKIENYLTKQEFSNILLHTYFPIVVVGFLSADSKRSVVFSHFVWVKVEMGEKKVVAFL